MKWLVSSVAAAAIGVIVPGLLGGWLPGAGDDSSDSDRSSATTPTVAVPQSRLISAERIGLFEVEANGTSEGATATLGQPTSRAVDGTECTMEWKNDGLRIRFYNLGAQDPCIYGRFCDAMVNGREWSTTTGLQVGERARRLIELYPKAKVVRELGEIRRYVLEPSTSPCGRDARGGLEGWTHAGKVFALRVNFAAGGG